MTPDSEGRQPRSDLATMLADMDGRLQRLQQELESVALPIARRPPEQLRASRQVSEPVATEPARPADVPAAPAQPADLRPAAASAAATLEADILTSPPRRPARRITATSRAAAPVIDAPPPPVPERRTHPRRRAGDADLASRPLPGRAPAATRPVPPPQPPPTADSSTPEAVVRQTILEAEEEARRVIEDARQRITEIGARTRALLEHSLNEPQAETAPTTPRRRRARTVKAARRAFEGTVVVEAGPFADVAQLSAFEDALGSIPTVADVYIRTFESNRAHFELHVTEPTALIVELQARAEDTLTVVAAGDGDLRLDIVRAGA